MAGFALVEAPQWQGSSAAQAARLAEAAPLLAGLLTPALRLRPELARGGGPAAGGVRHAGALTANLAALRAAVARAGGLATVVAGGDCGVEVAPVEAASRRYGDRLALVWLDAHGDLHTPATSPSGAFHGMVLRSLLGEGPPALRSRWPVAPGQVVLAGARALEAAEREFAARHRLRHLPAAGLAAGALAGAVAATGASAVYLHIDLDVLDPAEFGEVGVPVPGGVSARQLAGAVRALAARFVIAGIGITEYQPAGPAGRAVLAPLALAVADAAAAAPAGEVAQIEAHAVASWPAPTAEATGSWLLRHTPGLSRLRSCNAALPRRPDPHPAADLARVEAFYAARGRPAAVQLSPAARHHELDLTLAGRGWRRAAPIEVLTADTAEVAARQRAAAAPVTLAGELTAAWRGAFCDLDGQPDSAAVADQVIAGIGLPAAFLSVTLAGRPTGTGLITGGPDGLGGVYCMVTHPDARGRGIGSAILAAGARWAADHRITRLYLQVEQGNDAARRLYHGLGFGHAYSYHYRLAPAGTKLRQSSVLPGNPSA